MHGSAAVINRKLPETHEKPCLWLLMEQKKIIYTNLYILSQYVRANILLL